MRPKPVAFWLLIGAVLVVGTTWVWKTGVNLTSDPDMVSSSLELPREDEHDEPTVSAQPSTLDAASKVANSGSTGLDGNQFSPRTLTSSYLTAHTAQEARSVIEDIRLSGDSTLANDLERELHGNCGFLDGFKPPYERTRWAYEKLVEYCSSYQAPTDVSSVGTPNISVSKGLRHSDFMNKFSEMEFEEFEDYFADSVANAESMQQVRAAESMAKYLQESGTPLTFGLKKDRMSAPGSDSSTLRAAFTLFACTRFGGCRPDDFQTLQYCTLTGNCEQGWDMQDIYSYTLPPLEYERVASIVQYISQRQEDKPISGN
jgi:hypothetical protein